MTIFAIYFAVFIVIIIGVKMMERRNKKMLAIANEDAAFEGPVDIDSLTPERVESLRPLVDRVGVVWLANIEDSNSGRSLALERFEVFVIDVEGAIHDVGKAASAGEAAFLAREVASRLDVPIEDPERLLPDE